MRIIRPYGSSLSKQTANGLRRVLVDKSAERNVHEVPAFALSHDELVIAQWISVVDKIARKPAGRKKPSEEQRALRQRLGEACWERLIEGRHLSATDSERLDLLRNLWWFKIHPYGPGTLKPRRDISPTPKVEGRWHAVFVERDAAEIARRIEQHLYTSECRLSPDVGPRSRGKIGLRARSIRSNVLGPQKARTAWAEEDVARYTQQADPTKAIFDAAVALENNGKRITHADAARELFQHWSKVFCDEQGAPLKVKAARDKYPGMFELHMQLKQCYSFLLKSNRRAKRTRKVTRNTRQGSSQNSNTDTLSSLLPYDIRKARCLIDKQRANADLGHLVRLGKIIHYAASDGWTERNAPVLKNWPARIDGSRFWTSEGQAEIKRAEAFVRVWRQTIVFARLTLTDWASMKEPFDGDILGTRRELRAALDPAKFDRGHFSHKLPVLFGNRHELIKFGTDEDCRELLRRLISGIMDLRNAVFHFTGRRRLLKELKELPRSFGHPVMEAAKALWAVDANDRSGRLIAVLRGVYVEQFLTKDQATQLIVLLARSAPVELPLPRFSRILKRAENAWAKDNEIRLPKPANRRALEVPGRLCQYTVLKLIYERPFRSWLAARTAGEIGKWIDEAVTRADIAAKEMNARGDKVATKVIRARAANLPRPPDGGDVQDFFADLSSVTASEMRVQRGYESDPENAREQAAYIDDLLCDVVIRSFSAYLADQKLDWARNLSTEQPPRNSSEDFLEGLQVPFRSDPAEDWQAALYLFLHLLPVESVARLLHQLLKWEITAGRDQSLGPDDKPDLRRVTAALTLYLDMHDAKFEGETALACCREFKDLFETDTGFERVFPRDPGSDRQIPIRGLREMVRFGHLPLAKALGGRRKIADETIDRVFALEATQGEGISEIARLQDRREALHDEWVKNKKRLGAGERREYCQALAGISNHRQNSNSTRLVDHVRAHRTILTVLGRLVDYGGLFERDLYFTTLALIHQAGSEPSQMFGREGENYLRSGQIVEALRELAKNPKSGSITISLAKHFGRVWEDGHSAIRVRNNLAHLNMLRGANPKPQLTHWVNQTRQLMAYDRKLKNAVSKSVIDIMSREGVELRWDIKVEGQAHNLTNARLRSRQAEHLRGTRFVVSGGREEGEPLTEPLQSDLYIAMLAAAFGGKPQRRGSILDDLSKVDWEASLTPRRFGPRTPRPQP